MVDRTKPPSKWKYISEPLPDWVCGTMEERFTHIYKRRFWEEGESVSGPGSSLQQARVLIQELPGLWARLQVKTVLDVPCGDFNWMRAADLSGIDYIGGDIVPELVDEMQRRHGGPATRFLHLDFSKDELPACDLVLCRDGLVHLSFEDILRSLRNFLGSGATYLMATTFPDRAENRDIETGDWRPLNLEAAPIHLPAPVRLLAEGCPEPGYEDKSVGVWRMEDISLPASNPGVEPTRTAKAVQLLRGRASGLRFPSR